jgi:hypothetical protein
VLVEADDAAGVPHVSGDESMAAPGTGPEGGRCVSAVIHAIH